MLVSVSLHPITQQIGGWGDGVEVEVTIERKRGNQPSLRKHADRVNALISLMGVCRSPSVMIYLIKTHTETHTQTGQSLV